MTDHELLELTGYSYSGISDLIRNGDEDTIVLLRAIDNEYNAAKEKMEQLEKELESIKSTRGLLVSSFLYAHQALKLGPKPLCFISKQKVVVVERLEQNKMNYEAYDLTPLK